MRVFRVRLRAIRPARQIECRNQRAHLEPGSVARRGGVVAVLGRAGAEPMRGSGPGPGEHAASRGRGVALAAPDRETAPASSAPTGRAARRRGRRHLPPAPVRAPCGLCRSSGPRWSTVALTTHPSAGAVPGAVSATAGNHPDLGWGPATAGADAGRSPAILRVAGPRQRHPRAAAERD